MLAWILKTEPSTYSWGDLVAAGKASWDGVANPVAIANLKRAAVGDHAVIYHTGAEKACVGVARVTRTAYADPKDPKLVVIDLAPVKALAAPVTLATLKADAAFADSPIVRQGRLSVVPLDDAQWKRLLGLAKTTL